MASLAFPFLWMLPDPKKDAGPYRVFPMRLSRFVSTARPSDYPLPFVRAFETVQQFSSQRMAESISQPEVAPSGNTDSAVVRREPN